MDESLVKKLLQCSRQPMVVLYGRNAPRDALTVHRLGVRLLGCGRLLGAITEGRAIIELLYAIRQLR